MGYAADVEVRMQAPEAVRMGERFRLKVEVNARPDQFSPPGLNDFHVLNGPSTQTSFSTQIINGKRTQSFQVSYTYLLQPSKAGQLTISPARIKVDGKVYTSNSMDIEVVNGDGSSSGSNKQQSSSTGGQQGQKAAAGKDRLYVRLHVSDRNVYAGEHLVATLKIYTQLNVADFKMNFPSYDGFYKQDIEVPQSKGKRENVNGEIYVTKVLQKVLLYPQQTGTITIDPVELECNVRKAAKRRSGSMFDHFFGNAYQNVKKVIRSNPVKINVKEFPSPQPKDFSGAVGDFSMNVDVDQTDVRTNDAIAMDVSIKGSGNIKLLSSPQINFPPDFEVYDPEEKVSVNNTASGSHGRKTFSYLMIPRHSGKFSIPPVKFTYFDPTEGKFKTLQSGNFTINVAKGESEGTGGMVPAMTQKDLQYIGKDIRYIKTRPFHLKKINAIFVGTWRYYIALLLPFLIFILFIILQRKRIKENANAVLAKNKKANKLARKRLKTAARHMKKNETELFYEEMVRGLWGYLGDKLMIPTAELSKDKVLKEIEKFNLDKSQVEQMLTLIERCEFARYSPAGRAEAISEDYEEALSDIASLEKQLR